MGSGGARARSGPAPDPLSIRQLGKASEWTDLPATRTGSTPAWPSSPKATAREVVLWRRYWRKGQAILWERNGQHDEVAHFVRLLAAVETGEASTAEGTLLKQLRGELLLTIPAMLSAKIRIASDETTPRRSARKATPARPTATPSASRLTAVPDAAGQ